MPVAREGDKMSVVPIEKYGLSPSHAIHLEGIPLRGERRLVCRGFDYSSMHAADEREVQEIVRKHTVKSRKLATGRK